MRKSGECSVNKVHRNLCPRKNRLENQKENQKENYITPNLVREYFVDAVRNFFPALVRRAENDFVKQVLNKTIAHDRLRALVFVCKEIILLRDIANEIP